MTGALWAALSGVGFGVFQAVNRRGVGGMDVYWSTFLQLLVATAVLAAASLATEDIGLLTEAPLAAYVNFGLAAFFHFFVGWTLLNLSQKRIGAARTSPLIATNPVFGVVIAAMALGELPGAVELLAIGVIVAGGYAVSSEPGPGPAPVEGAAVADSPTRAAARDSVWGLGAAFFWAVSPIFIRRGLEDLPSPLLGLTVGIAACVAAYAVALAVRHRGFSPGAMARDALAFKLVAGVLVGLATWARWIALDLSAVAVVLALSLISIPVVLVLSPVVSGRHLERVTARLWLGAALVIAGSLLLIATA